MPDGRELVLGGIVNGRVQRGAWLRDVRTGALITLSDLKNARAWHTATLLPDGSVLVLGGVDRRGAPVAVAERFDPATNAFEAMPALSWRARSGHSVTLVDESRVVIAGGIVGRQPVGDVEVLEWHQWRATPMGTLSAPRAYHSASLLADGRAILWGGHGLDASAATSGATVDVSSRAISEIFAQEHDDPLLSLAASNPSDGGITVGAPKRIMLRFSAPARMETINTTTVTLTGPAGGLAVNVVPAEGGRLAFITPEEGLQPNASYLVTVDGGRDARNRAFPLLSVAFTTTEMSGTDSSSDEVWDPRTDGGATWRRRRTESKWEKLAPLRASQGVTALSGQVLRLDGTPLSGVTLELEGRSAATDATGRFLLVNEKVPTGWHELWIDGRKAKSRRAVFGTFEAAVWITAGNTAVLPFTIWMPAIDTAHAVRIQSPTTSETVVTTPLIPELELRLPAGAVITDEEGKVVREVSITPIPVDQPPFPLPMGVDVPIYFTIQPGGAYVSVPGSGGYQRGARLIYPNYRRRPSGGSMEFWHYEPEDGRGWYVYGRGTVSADGRQVIPDRGVSIHEFTGAMVAPPGLAPGTGPSPTDPGKDGDPVHLGTGLFVLDKTDLMLFDVSPIAISRTYRQNDTVARSFGIGATHQYDIFLIGDTYPYTYTDLVLPDGGRVHYTRISSGTGYADAVYEHTSTPSHYFKSRISWNGTGWNLDLRDGSRITFRDGFAASRPAQAAATRIQDRYGNAIVLTRDAAADLTRITSPNGRWIELTYDASHRVTQAKDNIGRIVGYTYDASGRLWKVTDPANGITEYTYDASHRMLTLKDARGIVFLTNEYDANGRVFKQTQADNTTYQFAYTLDGMGRVTQTDVTDPRGIVRRAAYNAASGFITSDTEALGTAMARTTTYVRDIATNRVTRLTDGLGRHTDYSYDASGNVTSVTKLASTGNAVTTSYTYEPTFSQLTSITDPLNHTTTLTRDSLGNLTTITDPLNHQTTFTYNAAAQPLTVTTPAGTTQFTYDGGDLVAITDPLGRTSTRFVDSAGRVVQVANPLGHATLHEYNALNHITKTIDALGGQTTFTYDANGNLLTLTDARNNTTTYTYNTMDRLATRTDPLSRVESYVYDYNGNLQQVTDRKSQVTGYTYDALNRMTTVTYNDSSTTTHTYDAGDRLTQVVDSIAGTITRTYDLFDRVLSETTPEGSISYTYDAADRRATMTVAGQPQVTYAYDNANRLTGITQGTATVGFTYDAADRRTVLTLPNAIMIDYGYDAASQITSLTYKLGANTLGDLTYTYDLAGNRTVVGGTWARTGLPAALASATYNAANQITTWGGTSFTSDLNANLTNDGTNVYAWSARSQLAGLSGGANASFAHDGVGRRRGKTVSGTTTNFLYDGLNIVQELTTGGTPTANLVTSLGIDETFTRTDSGGTNTILSDALGSTLALANASGSVLTSYTFEPFGATTLSGAPSTNAIQFTGRENDGTGLYYYRARYYHQRLQRFVAEDPIGFDAGDANLHAYVGNEPTRLTDPTGLVAFLPPPGCQPPGGRKDPPLWWWLSCSPFVVPDGIPPQLLRWLPRPPSPPPPPRRFEPPTNPPQLPPKEIPPDWRIREMPSTPDYPDGYWKLEKPMRDGSWQPIDPSTMKPGTRPQTHIPLPPKR